MILTEYLIKSHLFSWLIKSVLRILILNDIKYFSHNRQNMTENEQPSICYFILQVLNQCILFLLSYLNHFSFIVFYF